ncbi:MAG: TIGR01777 family oxidoreductase [Bacteroidia bacterium]|nr:TIGR01777 family oxidoreductase [Bacteroidia bacterium]
MKPSEKILIAGGSGFIGSALKYHFIGTPYREVTVLSRKADDAENQRIHWSPDSKIIDYQLINETNVLIYLAGASIIAKRWTQERKKEILRSRKAGLDFLFETLAGQPHSVRTLISASAVGIYGNSGNVLVSESAPPDPSFLAEVCRIWEEAALRFRELGIRVVIFRIGMVLSRAGGGLPMMSMPVKWFAGAPLGKGTQYISWIHIHDLVRLVEFAIGNPELHGIFNAVSPAPVSHQEFMKTLALVLHRPLWFIHIPAGFLRLLLGERAQMVLEGQRVDPGRIQDAGFRFEFPLLKAALQEIYKTKP